MQARAGEDRRPGLALPVNGPRDARFHAPHLLERQDRMTFRQASGAATSTSGGQPLRLRRSTSKNFCTFPVGVRGKGSI
jgi:hypothetical protein